jgi:hypothetical protein
MTRTSALIFGLALAAATPALAQAGPGMNTANPTHPKKAAQPAGASAPLPDAEMQQLESFVGTWHCTGHAEASPFGPAHDTSATVHVGTELSGFWLMGRYEEAKTTANPAPWRFHFVWGHDGAQKKFTGWGFDTIGGAWKQTSSGWESDKLVWAGESTLGGQSTGVRDTFVKKGDNGITHMGEMQANGQWVKLDEESCTRSN